MGISRFLLLAAKSLIPLYYRADVEKFREDLMNIARTTLSSKILSQHKEFFAKIAVDAVLRLKGSGNLQAIQIIKKQGGTLTDSFLDTGFLLDKKPGVNQPKRVENAKILIANTPMDTDKIKVLVQLQTNLKQGSLIYVKSGLRLAHPRRLRCQGRRTRTGREREDEGES